MGRSTGARSARSTRFAPLFDSQAKNQHEHVLNMTCKTFGADHPHTITPLHNTGLMTWAMGDARRAKEFIFSAIKSSEQPKHVVITHYLPSFRSIDPRFAESPLNGYFATDLDKEILDAEPQVWIHGHTHASCNYEIGKTLVLCNPYGYQHIELNKQYSENTLLEL